MKTIIKLSIFLCLVFFSIDTTAQRKPVFERVKLAKSGGTEFKVLSNAVVKGRENTELLTRFLNPDEVAFLQYNNTVLSELDTAMLLRLPSKAGDLQLELVEAPASNYHYQVRTSDGSISKPNPKIRHYRGIVSGDPNSLVAISFLEEEIMGVIATDEGNLNLALDRRTNQHILYNDKNVVEKPPFECEMDDEGFTGYDPDVLIGHSEKKLLEEIRCTRLYYETEFDIFQTRGTVASVEGFITGLHNQVATLYQNENLETIISEIFVWTTADPYTGTTTATLLTQFQSNTTSINGDLGHLVTFRNIGGGRAAGFNGLCNSNVDNSLAVSMLNNDFLNVPNYSWSVQVVTHEFGHLFGSRHTHACVWNGNNTAIDGCNPNGTEGGCPVPGIPSGGGTIMSYCHLEPVGINFNLGFGPQPGNVIRNSVSGASCLCNCFFGVVAGANDFCTSSVYTIGSLPAGSTVTWAASPSGLVTLTPSGNSVTLTKVGNGIVNLTATVSTPCNTSVTPAKQIRVGAVAKIPNLGSPGSWTSTSNPFNPSASVCVTSGTSLALHYPSPAGDPVTNLVAYSISGGGTPSVSGTSVYWSFSVSPYGTLRIEYDMNCGHVVQYVNVFNTCFTYSYGVFPNPANTELTVSHGLQGPEEAEKALEVSMQKFPDLKERIKENKALLQPQVISGTITVILLDNNGKILISKQSEVSAGKTVLDVSQIPDGNYFLHIKNGESTEKKQVVIRH